MLKRTVNIKYSRTGDKVGSSSKYHNVGYDAARNKYYGGVSVGGTMYKQRRFKKEVNAALYVDSLLDELGDKVRPRNFPEGVQL